MLEDARSYVSRFLNLQVWKDQTTTTMIAVKNYLQAGNNTQRKSASEIQEDDAAVFFEDVKNDDPNIMVQKGSDGKYDSSTGSQAFHIGVVASVTAIAGTDLVDLDIAESSGAPASSGGNGVNVRSLGKVKATVLRGLVWVLDGKNRIYFTGKVGPITPYLPVFLAARSE